MATEEKKEEENKKIKFPLRDGDLVEGTIIALKQDGIYLDIGGLLTGIIRGPEAIDESGKLRSAKKGDKMEATVIEVENEKGLVELSLRYASHKKAWDSLKEIFGKGEVVKIKIVDANKGGLIVKYKNFQGFLPASQLQPQHYPRVEDGDKMKILEKLKAFVGKELDAKIITLEETEEKIIFSEKQIQPEEETIKYKKGDIVEAKVTGLASFGAFVTFDKGGEGLIHISELDWKRIEKPEEAVKIGQVAKAKIIDFAKDGKAALSIKQLRDDPWKKINEKYHVDQIVKGKVLKINPFGLFVLLDSDIHGLCHVSELDLKEGEKIESKFKLGEKKQFKIISLEPEDHRLSLSPSK